MLSSSKEMHTGILIEIPLNMNQLRSKILYIMVFHLFIPPLVSFSIVLYFLHRDCVQHLLDFPQYFFYNYCKQCLFPFPEAAVTKYLKFETTERYLLPVLEIIHLTVSRAIHPLRLHSILSASSSLQRWLQILVFLGLQLFPSSVCILPVYLSLCF